MSATKNDPKTQSTANSAEQSSDDEVVQDNIKWTGRKSTSQSQSQGQGHNSGNTATPKGRARKEAKAKKVENLKDGEGADDSSDNGSDGGVELEPEGVKI